MTMSTDQDVFEYMPDLADYGIQDFASDHAKTREDILRRLRVEWWPRFRPYNDIRFVQPPVMDTDLLDETQFTRAAVYHVLSYYILPKLAKFDPDGDRFGEMMKHYRSRFEEEFDYIIKDGVRYDFDDNGNIDSSEQVPAYQTRLVR